MQYCTYHYATKNDIHQCNYFMNVCLKGKWRMLWLMTPSKRGRISARCVLILGWVKGCVCGGRGSHYNSLSGYQLCQWRSIQGANTENLYISMNLYNRPKVFCLELGYKKTAKIKRAGYQFHLISKE